MMDRTDSLGWVDVERESPLAGLWFVLSVVTKCIMWLCLATFVGILFLSFLIPWERENTLANKCAALVQIQAFEQQIMLFKLDNGRIPTAEEGLQALRVAPHGLSSVWQGPYIEKEVPRDPWGNDYRYNVLDGEPWVRSAGADMEWGTEDDISTRDEV